jgi:uncharacterized protein YhhL (DUF1145 family)
MPNLSWIKNPLGIIAIFISLIYGISGLLFSSAIKDLSPQNQTVMVWFVVLFPPIVLGVFAWLVVKHHYKLYAPGDYRSDDMFGRTFPTATRKEVAQKRQDENQAQLKVSPEAGDLVTFKLPETANAPYVLEQLAIQTIEKRFDGFARRDVKIASDLIIDGLLEKGNSVVLVEIKVLRTNMYSFTAIQAAGRTLRMARDRVRFAEPSKRILTVIVLVVERLIAPEELKEQKARLSQDETPDLIEQLERTKLLAGSD